MIVRLHETSSTIKDAAALAAKADHLLLDSLTPQQAAEWIAQIGKRAKAEVYAETGADYVSVGAITHSARAVDISFRLVLA